MDSGGVGVEQRKGEREGGRGREGGTHRQRRMEPENEFIQSRGAD
jgi:hypothetical protein